MRPASCSSYQVPFNIKYTIFSSDICSRLRTRGLSFPRDPSRGKRGAQGTQSGSTWCPLLPSPPRPCSGRAPVTGLTYINGYSTSSEEQDPQQRLACASLRLLQLLCFKPQARTLPGALNPRPLGDFPLWRERKGRAVFYYQRLLLHIFFPVRLSFPSVSNRSPPGAEGAYVSQRISGILHLGAVLIILIDLEIKT